jgi:dihydroorotate dehydrogenase (NAD+) catalytic subunit
MTSYNLSVRVGGLTLESPVIIASGVWPYEAEFWTERSLKGIGAVCTKAISRRAKLGNGGIRLWETPAGVLNSIGLQNGGAEHFAENYLERVASCPRPVIANVVMEGKADTAETLAILSDAGGIAAVELNISCPNVDGDGMAWGTDCTGAAEAVRTARAAWEGDLWVKMTPQAHDLPSVARAAEDEGADAIVVGNTWLGAAMDMETARPAFDRVVAGLSGPAIFPLALRTVWQVCGAVKIPVVGCGGVSDAESCAAMLLAGASAVEAGTAFFRDLRAGEGICGGLPQYLEKYGLSSLSEMTGFAGRPD